MLMGIRFSEDVPPSGDKLSDLEANGNQGNKNESTTAHTRPEDLAAVAAGKESESADSEKAKNSQEVLRPVVNLSRCAYHLI